MLYEFFGVFCIYIGYDVLAWFIYLFHEKSFNILAAQRPCVIYTLKVLKFLLNGKDYYEIKLCVQKRS
jgi:hypothetical protein